MSIHLTEGALKKIISGDHVEQPILKILGYRLIRDQHERKRYQLFITDNINYTSLAVLDFNVTLIEILQKFKKNFIVQIINYSINDAMGEEIKYVMVIKEMNAIAPSGNESNTAPSTSDKRLKVPMKIIDNVTGKLLPISKLIPKYPRQTIKAKVLSKKRYNEKTFSAVIQDESGKCIIMGTDDKVKFFDMIQENTTYYFVGVCVYLTKKSSNFAFQLYFQTNTLVIPLEHDYEESDISQAFSYILKEGYIASENGIDSFNCYGTVIDVCTAQCPYKACNNCQKKVTKDKSGNYYCFGCKISCNVRDKLLLTINIGDFSWKLEKLTVYDKVVEKFLEVETQDIARYVGEDNANYWKIFNAVIYKPYRFQIAARNTSYQKFKTLKSFRVVCVEKANYKQRCNQLLTEIKSMYTFWRAYTKYMIEKPLKEDLPSIETMEI